MSKIDREKIWTLVFGATILELENVEQANVKELHRILWNNQGDSRKQAKELVSYLGTNGWRWNAYEEPCDDPSEYREMALAFANHIQATVHALYRREQLVSLSSTMPYWEFVSIPGISPSECGSLNGTIRHFTDSFWDSHLPPCGRPCCRCQIHALSERQLDKRKN